MPTPGHTTEKEREKQELKQEADDLAAQARARGSAARDELVSGWHHARQRISEDARHAATEIQSQASAAMEDRKSAAASYVRDTAAAVHGTAEQLREKNDHALAGYVDGFADQIDTVGNYINSHQVDELAEDTRCFAREHPGVFFGSLLVAGIAFGRILRASENHHPFDVDRPARPEETSPSTGRTNYQPGSSLPGSPGAPPTRPQTLGSSPGSPSSGGASGTSELGSSPLGSSTASTGNAQNRPDRPGSDPKPL